MQDDLNLRLEMGTDPQVVIPGRDSVDTAACCSVSVHTLCEGQVCEHWVLVIANDVYCQGGGGSLFVHNPLVSHSQVQLRG